MDKRLTIPVGLVIVSIIGLIWIGYILTNTKVSQEPNLTKDIIPNNKTISSYQNAFAKITADKSGLPDKKPQKIPNSPSLAYAASPDEKALYFKGISILLPHTEKYLDDNPDFYANMNKKRAEALAYFENLIETYPDSAFYAHYYEITSQLRKMVEEDKNWKGGHPAKMGMMIIWSSSFEDSTAENIYHLRYCLYAKDNEQGRYKLILPRHSAVYPNTDPILHPSLNVESLIKWPAKRDEIVHSLLDLLEDQRPIIAVESDKIPARFYRYQDAAKDILEHIAYEVDSDKKLQEAKKDYRKNHPDDEGWQSIFVYDDADFGSPSRTSRMKKIPLQELSEAQYFSEYLEKQTPQERQNTIHYIKTWVGEAMANSPKQEQPPEEPK
jgi:hypothetical protein